MFIERVSLHAIGVLVTVVLSCDALEASDGLLSIRSNFLRSGKHESLIVPLGVYGGSTTGEAWSGLVELTVSGFGFTTPGSLTDAFYPLDPTDPSRGWPGSVQGLRLSFNGCATSFECGAPRMEDFIVYIESVGGVSPPVRPPYSVDHVYSFVIEIGPEPRFMTIGEGDGGVFDNWGELRVEIDAVTRAPDCNDNGVGDIAETENGGAEDCNENRSPDACDVDTGLSQDCDGNGLPDECASDCNQNGEPDACDLDSGLSADCQANGVPDECDLEVDLSDFNVNGLLDECEVHFVRGDANADGAIDISDGMTILLVLFSGRSPPTCLDAMDVNDDSAIDIGDAIGMLAFVLTGGFPPPLPGTSCGLDMTSDPLPCESFDRCRF